MTFFGQTGRSGLGVCAALVLCRCASSHDTALTHSAVAGGGSEIVVHSDGEAALEQELIPPEPSDFTLSDEAKLLLGGQTGSEAGSCLEAGDAGAPESWSAETIATELARADFLLWPANSEGELQEAVVTTIQTRVRPGSEWAWASAPRGDCDRLTFTMDVVLSPKNAGVPSEFVLRVFADAFGRFAATGSSEVDNDSQERPQMRLDATSDPTLGWIGVQVDDVFHPRAYLRERDTTD